MAIVPIVFDTPNSFTTGGFAGIGTMELFWTWKPPPWKIKFGTERWMNELL